MLPSALPGVKSARKTRVREVLAQLEEARFQYNALKPPRTTIVPGCNHCKLKLQNGVAGRVSIVPRDKPRFIEKLELFVKIELKNVTPVECGANDCHNFLCNQKTFDAKLRVYREAFEVLINKIVTFRPLLTRIKYIYDKCIEARDNRIELMDTLAQDLNEYKKSVEDRIEFIREKAASESRILQAEKKELEQQVSRLEGELRESNDRIDRVRKEMSEIEERELQSLVERQSKALASNFETKPTIAFERRGSRIVLTNTTETYRIDDELSEDPVLLSVCLRRTRKDLGKAHKRITELEETFRDVVPKRDLERLENKYQSFERQYETLSNEVERLAKENEILKANFEVVREQKNSLRDRCKILANTNTPRPDWSKCGQFIQGGVQRWRDITAKKSSEDRLIILLSELCGAACAENEYFVGQGTDSSVPIFLRYKGKVKNRKLGRREVSILINDIWRNKVISNAITPMGDYVLKYFTERYHLPLLRYEWIYNLYNACQRLVYDSQIGLFWDILWGNVSEDGYHSVRKEFVVLKKMMDMRMEDKKINALLAEDIIEILDNVYPYKSNQNVESIVYAAAKQLGIDPSTEAFEIEKLFAQNDEGWERGEFAQEIFRQTEQEIREFGESALEQISVQEKNTKISVDLLKRGFTEIDKGISQNLLMQHMKWIYKVQDLNKAKPMIGSSIIRQMLNGYIRRSHRNERRN